MIEQTENQKNLAEELGTVPNESPKEKKFEYVKTTIPMKNDEGKFLSRRFLGELVSPSNCKNQKELKAYLKGHSSFEYKKRNYPVRQEYFYV